MAIEKSTDFRFFIKRDYENRKIYDPNLTLVSYAKYLGVSAQQLNQVLKGKIGISSHLGKSIAQKINLTTYEKELFCTLIDSKHSRNKIARESANAKLEKLNNQSNIDTISLEEFTPVSEWYYMAACMLVDLEGFNKDMKWISSRLGISESLSQKVFDELFEHGFLRIENDKWVRDSDSLSLISKVNSTVLQKYHKQILNLVNRSFEKKTPPIRYLSSTLLTICKEDFDSLKLKTDHFRKELLLQHSYQKKKPDRLISMSIQLLDIDESEQELQ